MLNTNMTTPRVSEAPGAQGGPLLLQFYVNVVQKWSETGTWWFLRMLNMNMTTPKVSEALGTLDRPLLQFYVDFVQNQSEIIARVLMQAFTLYNAKLLHIELLLLLHSKHQKLLTEQWSLSQKILMS